MKNISYKNVNITGGFWQSKQDLNESVTVNAVYDRFYETGRVGAFKCLWREGDEKNPSLISSGTRTLPNGLMAPHTFFKRKRTAPLRKGLTK